MNRFLIRLFFVAALLCGVLGFTDGVKEQGITAKGEQKNEHQIKQNDGYQKYMAEEPQSPVEVVFSSATSSHRVASSRPTRLLPTHGGKPGKYYGRWFTDVVNKPFRIATLQRCSDINRRYTVVASPRLRYVIAQRRLLC